MKVRHATRRKSLGENGVAVRVIELEGWSGIGDSNDPPAECQQLQDQRSSKKTSTSKNHAGIRVQLREIVDHHCCRDGENDEEGRNVRRNGRPKGRER